MSFYGRDQLKPFEVSAVSHQCYTYQNSLQDHVKGVAMINTPICAGDHSTMAWGHTKNNKNKMECTHKKNIYPTIEGKIYYQMYDKMILLEYVYLDLKYLF